MKTERTKVTARRVRQLLECYGASPAAWPQGERAAALAVLNRSEPLRRAQERTLALDQAMGMLDTEPGAPADAIGLAQRILNGLPVQEDAGGGAAVPVRRSGPRTTGWLNLHGWQVGAFATGLAALVLALVVTVQPPASTPQQVATARLDPWLWEEVLDQAPEDGLESGDMALMLEYL